jgi:hypothetical protein
MKLEGKVVIAQGGGPTAVINQSLVGLLWKPASSIRLPGFMEL